MSVVLLFLLLFVVVCMKNLMHNENEQDKYIIEMTYPLKPLRLLMGDAVEAAEFSVDNAKSETM